MATSAPPDVTREDLPAWHQLTERFETLLDKTIRLKEFAIKNNYEVDLKILKDINDLTHKVATRHPPSSVNGSRPEADKQKETTPPAVSRQEPTAEDLVKLDKILGDLTAITFPATVDNISKAAESVAYRRFKRWLFNISALALVGAVTGFVCSVHPPRIPLEVSNSVLALSLGLLGALVYSFFGVLRVIPAQAFNPEDEYANYARLVLGILLGWIFYFAFAREAFLNLTQLASATSSKASRAEVLWILLPFLAGYSTKFVIGVLERSMVALETALAISDKRDTINRRPRRNRT